jgi:6-pyruvoyltetrahydropterin/6-carboxytetrahydropterin synthase
MYSVTKEFHFCAAHRLHNYSGKCQFIHGHNYKVLITLEGCVREGMVKDFGDIKSTIGKWIDDRMDHAMIISQQDEFLFQEWPRLMEKGIFGKIFTMEGKTTAENMAKVIYDEAVEQLDGINGVHVKSVDVYETDSSKARYEL